MANNKHVAMLKKGVDAWNAWRRKNRNIRPDLSEADLENADLQEANLSGADLENADLRKAHLVKAWLPNANLTGADLNRAKLGWTNLTGADLNRAKLSWANLYQASIGGANLAAADLRKANLQESFLMATDLKEANLSGANLAVANLRAANLAGANLSGADLEQAVLVETDLTVANLTGCRVYGVSAWRLKLDSGTKQQNLVITRKDEPAITVDNIEVAQFIYLMLNNQKVRDVIDTITSKVVLILGRFTKERKAVLDWLRDELRKPERGYVPVVFDFEKSRSQTTAETVTLLARMARFVIADLSDAKSVLQELQAIVPSSPKLAVQPVIISAQDEPGMFDSIEIYRSVAKTYRYDDLAQLTANLDKRVIRPAEAKVSELRGP